MTEKDFSGEYAEWTIDVSGEATRALFTPARNPVEDLVFVCAHGAGGRMNDRSMIGLANALGARGISMVRFNFLYREKGSGRPDQMPRLEKCFEAVVARTRAELEPKTLLIGGRSMGGRAASMMAAKGYDCDGLLLFAYPLHPPGQLDKLRDAHLPSITVPVLCFNGTRDTFCTPDLMMKALEAVMTRWDMQWLESADHSFHVPKSSGRNDAQVLDEVAGISRKWVDTLTKP
ncbi:MAG TPA: alpha/beta family hydrolase [Gemmatimonadaceae bacterium]|nr:alpha/beta family hydrolase [Gemmatimonadaceae bacterium]